MNILLDENFPKKAKAILEASGFNVFDVRGTANEGLPDIEIFNIAKKEKALFLTTDRDFSHTIHLTQKPHNGIVVINLKNPNTKNILEKLSWFIDNYINHKNDNTCYLITDTKCNIYK
jgi:predicted nuclease of predicted toxin-antitoxin system